MSLHATTKKLQSLQFYYSDIFKANLSMNPILSQLILIFFLTVKSLFSVMFLSEYPNPNKFSLDDTDTKLEKAIKAAEAAGLTMTKIPTYEYKEVEIKEDMPTIHDRNLLAELNSDSFVQKSFVSSKNKKHSQNIVIDLNAETVTVPETDVKVQADDSIIDFNVSYYIFC